MEAKLDNIALLKVIMMLLVVFYHACMFFTGNWFVKVEPVYEAKYIAELAYWLNTFHVQTFTMASGYIFYYLRYSCGKYRDLKSDLKKRCFKLIIPYITTSICWVIPISIFFYGLNLKQLFKDYVLGISPSQLWFLLMLFWVWLFFYFFSDKIVVSWKSMIIFFVFSCLCSGILVVLGINCLQINTAIKYSVFFFFGGFLFHNKIFIKKRYLLLLFIVSLIAYYGLYIMLDVDCVVIEVMLYWYKTFVSILEIFVMVCTVQHILLNERIAIFLKKFTDTWEQSSFGIYLFHQQIIYFCIMLLNGKVYPSVQVFLSFLISLFLSKLIVKVLSKFRMTRFVFGL